MNTKKTITLIIALLTLNILHAGTEFKTAVDYPSGTLPGKAHVSEFYDNYKLYNNVLELVFKTDRKAVMLTGFKNKHDAAVFDLTKGSLFVITLNDGISLTPVDFQLTAKPKIENISSRCDSVVLADRFPGKKIVLPLISKNGQIAIEWVLSLRDGSNYIRQEITIKAVTQNLPISKIQMLDFPAQTGNVAGVLAGCPIVAGNIFLGYENPNAWAKIYDPASPVNLALGKNITFSSETEDGPAKNAINGDISTKNYWIPEKLPAELIIDLGKEISIDKVNLHLAYNFNLTYYWFKEWIYQYKVETSTDGQNWQKVAEKNNDKIAAFEPDELTFGSTISRFVKVTLLKHNMDGTNNSGLRQVEIFSSAENNAKLAKLSKEQKTPRIQATLNRNTELPANSQITQSAVLGVVPEGQLRRGFLYYIERQRAHPYRGFLHYNSFYDIVLKNESDCVQRITKIGDEITKKYNTVLQSYAFDDGWDNPQTLWQFHDGFPQGFENMKTEAAKYNSALGVWMSPSGGYGTERKKYAESMGYKTNKNGISMADEIYYKAFLNCCSDMMTKYNVNYFKFDRLGEGLHTFGGTADYTEDVEATLRLMQDMRKIKPDVFINLTVGAWASPYLLFYCDSLWRDGGDSDFFGQGTKREQWITYR
ncbi:MAG TPA: discoidin domain-containing protein, partial [Sedimentisphaerales bacterium]|nr:discoidin domain-containing protein [Sedimentisphaerales bacterium]